MGSGPDRETGASDRGPAPMSAFRLRVTLPGKLGRREWRAPSGRLDLAGWRRETELGLQQLV